MHKQSHKSSTQAAHDSPPGHHLTTHIRTQGHQHSPQHAEQYEYEYQHEDGGVGRGSQAVPQWKYREQRKKMRKQIFGDHYNYNYKRPNQQKMYRAQENRNTEIERSNRILLQKIQSIFKRSMGRKRLKQITTSEAVSTSQLTNKTSHMVARSQPHSVSNIKNTHMGNIQQQIQSKLQQRGNGDNRNRRNMVSMVDKIGDMNKNIVDAKKQLDRNGHTSKGKKDGEINRNLVRLQELQNSMVNKRKRIQTEMNKPVYKYSDKVIGNTSQVQDEAEPINSYQNIQQPIPIQNQNNKKTSRKTITSNSEHSPNAQKHQIPATNRSSSKIVLHRTTTTLNNKPYFIELYVEANTYVISAKSQRNGKQYHELITMPYGDYRELYRAKLGECHEGILGFLYVEPVNGLLQVRGFESKFMDIVQYGEIGIQQPAKDKQEESRVSSQNLTTNIIVHYSNNNAMDDPFDRMTYANSELKNDLREINSTPGPIIEQRPAKIDPKEQGKPIEDIKGQSQSRVKRKIQLSSHLIEVQIAPIAKMQEKLAKQELFEKNQQKVLSIQSPKQQKGEQLQEQDPSIHFSEPKKPTIKQSKPTKQQYQIQNKKQKIYDPYAQDQYENEEIISDNQ